MLFNQGHFGTQACGHNRRDQSRRAGSDDHDVVATARLRVDPIGRMHIGDELLVVLVIGKNQRLLVRAHLDDPW